MAAAWPPGEASQNPIHMTCQIFELWACLWTPINAKNINKVCFLGKTPANFHVSVEKTLRLLILSRKISTFANWPQGGQNAQNGCGRMNGYRVLKSWKSLNFRFIYAPEMSVASSVRIRLEMRRGQAGWSGFYGFLACRLKSRKAGSFRKLEIEAGKAGKLKWKFRKRENEAGKAAKLKRKG